MNIAVIFAGGVGKRMKAENSVPKQFLEIDNKPILIHTLEIFQNSNDIDAIVIPCVSTHIDLCKEIVEKHNISKVKSIVKGGKTAQLSTLIGLEEAYKLSKNKKDIVLIHDGVRPLINQMTITDNINCVKKYGSAITSAKCKETILINAEKGDSKTLDREKALIARAPQSFYLNEILGLSRLASEEKIEVIDSCTLMGNYNHKIKALIGPDENIKITTQDDFILFKGMYEKNMGRELWKNI